MGKRYYPIVENFDDVKGLELEGPLGTVSADECTTGQPASWLVQSVKEKILEKVSEDDRFGDGEFLLKIKKGYWEPRYSNGMFIHQEGYSYIMECDVYRVKHKERRSKK